PRPTRPARSSALSRSPSVCWRRRDAQRCERRSEVPMSDLRTHLDRVAQRARPVPDPFERLALRLRRHQRNRRITAGILAVAVAAGGALAAFTAFHQPATGPASRFSNGALVDPELGFDVSPGTRVGT